MIYSQSGPTLDGFRLSGSQEKSIIVSDDDSLTKNRIEFLYTVVEDMMFYYHAVIPDGSGTVIADPSEFKVLSINQESVEIGVRPEHRVTAETDTGLYQFVGWYTDEACTVPVSNAEIGGEYVLTGTDLNQLKPLGSNVDMNYYAKYDYKRGDLVIDVTGSADESQVFSFVIKGKTDSNDWIELKICIQGNGSQTVKDLPIGEYEIVQTDWSWRYEGVPDSAAATVTESETETVTFTESMTNNKWLDGNEYKDNIFSQRHFVQSICRSGSDRRNE